MDIDSIIFYRTFGTQPLPLRSKQDFFLKSIVAELNVKGLIY